MTESSDRPKCKYPKVQEETPQTHKYQKDFSSRRSTTPINENTKIKLKKLSQEKNSEQWPIESKEFEKKG